MLITANAAQAKNIIQPAGATQLIYTEVLSNIVAIGWKSSAGWVAFAITGAYAKSTFDSDFSGFSTVPALGVTV